MKIALAQINPFVGDIQGNKNKIKRFILKAKKAGAKLVVFPELSLWGYPPRDLLEFDDLIQQSDKALVELAKVSPDMAVIVGTVMRRKDVGKPHLNVAAWLEQGEIAHVIAKRLLPSYDVFDETRYFEAGQTSQVIEYEGIHFGVTICEDIWSGFLDTPSYREDPVVDLVSKGARTVLNLSASPFSVGKIQERIALLKGLSQRQQVTVVYVNQVGGQDELIFDGGSLVFNQQGRLLHLSPFFRENLTLIDLAQTQPLKIDEDPEPMELLEGALILGLKDYIRKCGFKKVALGLSGGVDSAVVAALAVKALGPQNVLGLIMPSRYSSGHSQKDARQLAKNLKIRTIHIPINPLHREYEKSFKRMWGASKPDATEENIQARIRGNLLMALSNKKGHLILSTGNKSEMAVGYTTLYGDMCGGLSVISDVPKMMVYELAHLINQKKEVIPLSTLTKAPSAELRKNQTDQESLPPYEVLDAIVKARVEEKKSAEEIVAKGFIKSDVQQVLDLIKRNEYKRRQAAPGLKVTSKAFGVGRRMPIACKY